MSVQINSASAGKWISVDIRHTPHTADELLVAANNDHVAYLLSAYFGLVPNSSTFWLVAHSLEKYLKAIILSTNPSADVRIYRHNLVRLLGGVAADWSKFRAGDFITEVSRVTIDVRYNQASVFIGGGLTTQYAWVCAYLRSLLSPKHIKDQYGIDLNLLPRHFLGYQSIEAAPLNLLHLFIEHGIDLSGIGIMSPTQSQDYWRDRALIMTGSSDTLCPVCNHRVTLPFDYRDNDVATVLHNYVVGCLNTK
jgi:hypothetical protein